MKILTRVGLVFLVFVLLSSFVRNVMRLKVIDERVKKAEINLEELKKKKEDLAQKLELVKSEDYLEKEARDKLGLAKEGEIVVVLPDKDVLRQIVPPVVEEPDTLPDPNWKKWARLFGLYK
ncbi:septum formation initiator family protein [Candidatus Woesebacteria bacterium]|nr:septum formation initiator family protein [Candidatus Woesebacteria bacterium]